MTEREKLLTLIRQCKNNDSAAQFELYKMTYNKAMAIIVRYVGNKHDAEDILSEAYYKMFKNLNKFNEERDFFKWFYRIIINTAIDYLRKHNKTKIDENESTGIEKMCDGNKENNLDYCRYLDAIQSLSPAYRLVFNLYVIDGYKHKEIAEKLGISVGTSKSNLVKAKRKLKEIFIKLKYLNE